MLFGGVAVLAACDSTVQGPEANTAQAAANNNWRGKLAGRALCHGKRDLSDGVQDVSNRRVQRPELTRNVMSPIRDDQFAMIGEMQAAGLTSQESSMSSPAARASYLKNPQSIFMSRI